MDLQICLLCYGILHFWVVIYSDSVVALMVYSFGKIVEHLSRSVVNGCVSEASTPQIE